MHYSLKPLSNGGQAASVVADVGRRDEVHRIADTAIVNLGSELRDASIPVRHLH